MRLWWRVLALCACGGCLFPLDTLQGGSADSGDADASDARTDAGDASTDSAITPFCANVDATAVLFCDDFDDTDASTFPSWNSASGIVTRDPSGWTSPPFSFLGTTVPTGSSANSQSANIKRTYARSVSRAIYAFDVRVDRFDTTNGNAQVNQLSIFSAGVKVEYRLTLSAMTTEFAVHIPPSADAGAQTVSFSLSPWLANRWYHVVFDINAATVPAAVTVAIDGNAVVGPSAAIAIATYGIGSSIEAQAGIYFSGNPQTGWALRIDNALVRVQ